MVEEESKAVQETAKATGKAIDAARGLGRFFNLVLGDACKEIGGIAHDWARYFREQNLLKIYDKLAAIHKKRKLEGKTIPIPSRLSLPLIQSASNEDEGSLQDMWAMLIANATDPNIRLNLKKVYIEILSSLEPMDVLIIKYLSEQEYSPGQRYGWGGIHDSLDGITIKKISDELNLDENDVGISVNNLTRLGCLLTDTKPPAVHVEKSVGQMIWIRDAIFKPSALGASLIDACADTETT